MSNLISHIAKEYGKYYQRKVSMHRVYLPLQHPRRLIPSVPSQDRMPAYHELSNFPPLP